MITLNPGKDLVSSLTLFDLFEDYDLMSCYDVPRPSYMEIRLDIQINKTDKSGLHTSIEETQVDLKIKSAK